MAKRRSSINQITGLSKAKRKISRQTGIPLTKGGRKQKMKRVSGGCLGLFALMTVLILMIFIQ
jgi:hypothetical protein